MRNPVVVFGLSGSGKSFVARILHEEFGYEWLRSDVIRKELMGVKPSESAKAEFGKGIYTEDITRRVYELMIKRADELVGEGRRVVLDATFLKHEQRELVKRRFPKALFILVSADEEKIRERLAGRRDVSDADFQIYLRQKEVFEPPKEVSYVSIDNTETSREALRCELMKLIV